MHWKHSRFEVAFVILGNCHTYDEAYRILCELEEDRDLSIKLALAESKRAQAKVVVSKTVIRDAKETQANKLQAMCHIEETAARKDVAQPCLDEARREIEFLRRLKAIIGERRQFRDHPDHVAHQLCQPLEWMLDLHWKTYNYMAAPGVVPHDHLMLLKMHPESKRLLAGYQGLREVYEAKGYNAFVLMEKHDVLPMVCEPREAHYLMRREAFPQDLITLPSAEQPKALAWETDTSEE